VGPLYSLACIALAGLGGCGGGGGDTATEPASWTSGVFQASTTFAAQCASPRSGTDPTTGNPYRDVQGSTLAENNFLRSWTNELYLWYREVPDLDPASRSTPEYFRLLKTPATTPSGNSKDQFHFTYPTTEWVALSQSGVEAGYGAQWAILAASPPRQVTVAYTEPRSPATTSPANLARGAKVLKVDGVDMVNASDATSVDKLNAGLFPAAAGETHVFSILDRGAKSPRNVTLVSANVTSTPVQNVKTINTAAGAIGYMLFNDHIATAEQQLIAGFTKLAAANVSGLVLDIRYNGGGYLDIASEVAYMAAGPGPSSGKGFETQVFNDKNPATNPVTGERLAPLPFLATSQGFSGPQGQPLPTLNLSQVVVLTGPSTCSASEAIINGLRGVDVQVIQIGSTTCGKPYGFYPKDNCGTTYFSIQFQGVNAKGFGDYPDGFSPANAGGRTGVSIPGCSVADDFGHALGDPAEGRLAAALDYSVHPTCPRSATGFAELEAMGDATTTDGRVYKSPWHENRILRR
jgi:C-terminal processing protease CtpA/Prc